MKKSQNLTRRFFFGLSILILSLSSCKDELLIEPQIKDLSIPIVDNVHSFRDDAAVAIAIDAAIEIAIDKTAFHPQTSASSRSTNPIYYQANPNGVQCGSRVLFLVKDFGNYQDIQVKRTLPNGAIHYQNMYRWQDYQYVFMNEYNCGDIFWEYVKKSNHASLIPTQNLKNTGVDINIQGTSHISWSFEDDGSSWAAKSGWYIYPGSPLHINEEIYAQDWNWGSGNDDLGKKINSPLCGEVVSAGWVNDCLGNTVDIVHYNGTNIVMYRVSHLDKVNVSRGQWISRNTFIGKLGDTGSSTCAQGGWDAHAHCVLYKLDNNYSITDPLQFDFGY